ncbi:hypothetical protein PM082_024832 [Marasmius tenuissimus]|nr:hypothetical protein PM082_024832 [Marasmius tenuissimus]
MDSLSEMSSCNTRAVPRRTDFDNRIAQGGSREKLDVEINKWLEALDVIVERMSSFL